MAEDIKALQRLIATAATFGFTFSSEGLSDKKVKERNYPFKNVLKATIHPLPEKIKGWQGRTSVIVWFDWLEEKDVELWMKEIVPFMRSTLKYKETKLKLSKGSPLILIPRVSFMFALPEPQKEDQQ